MNARETFSIRLPNYAKTAKQINLVYGKKAQISVVKGRCFKSVNAQRKMKSLLSTALPKMRDRVRSLLNVMNDIIDCPS